MKITDQGFTGRLSGNNGGASAVQNNGSTPGNTSTRQSSSDNLQLSSLASLLQNASASDAGRSARVSQIASAVQNNSFRIDPAQISSAMVSEALHA